MLKILFYINALNGGGAERVMTNLSNQLDAESIRVIFVTSYRAQGEYPLNENIKRYSLEETEIQQSRIQRNFSRIRKLRRICQEEKPDVVVSFMQEPNFRAICATFGLPTKTIVSVRNDPNREYAGKIGWFVGKVLLPMADGCVFQTEDARHWFPKKLQKKSTIIFNAVKESFYEISGKPVEGKIVTCGRLMEQKNQATLIDAFGMIADKHIQATLEIYGEGNLEASLQEQIEKLGLHDRVFLKGQTEHVEQVLQNASMFVLPSDYEGMPNALMEALAAGVPSIATDCPCGGPKMLIEHEINGLLVPVGDTAALANAMDRLLTDKVFAQKMGAAARESAEKYRPDGVFMQWKQYIEKIADGRS